MRKSTIHQKENIQQRTMAYENFLLQWNKADSKRNIIQLWNFKIKFQKEKSNGFTKYLGNNKNEVIYGILSKIMFKGKIMDLNYFSNSDAIIRTT